MRWKMYHCGSYLLILKENDNFYFSTRMHEKRRLFWSYYLNIKTNASYEIEAFNPDEGIDLTEQYMEQIIQQTKISLFNMKVAFNQLRSTIGLEKKILEMPSLSSITACYVPIFYKPYLYTLELPKQLKKELQDCQSCNLQNLSTFFRMPDLAQSHQPSILKKN